jgi:hypothetical protein
MPSSILGTHVLVPVTTYNIQVHRYDIQLHMYMYISNITKRYIQHFSKKTHGLLYSD